MQQNIFMKQLHRMFLNLKQPIFTVTEERQVLLSATDWFVLVNGYYSNVILLGCKNNGTLEYKKS